MSNGLSGISSVAYQGTNAPTPPNLTTHRNRPTPQYYQGFSIGDFWVYRPDPRLNTNELWVLMGVAGNVADWVMLTGNVGTVTDLKTDDGNIVTPTLGVINIYGGTGIVTTGTVGPNTVTISTSSAVATSYITSPATGTAIPAAGVLTFTDGNNITFTAGGSSVAAAVTGTTNHALQIGNSTGSLTSLAVGTNGQLPIGSTGANPVMATLTAGSNISITNGAGSITIASTNTGGTVTTLHTDDGNNVTQTAGVINVAGAFGISTTGTVGPNTVTVNGPAKKASFFAYLASTVTNVTGDGTAYTIVFDSTLYNQGSAYNTANGRFTAPVTGFYMFSTCVLASNIGAGHTFGNLNIGPGSTVDNKAVQTGFCSPAAVQTSDNKYGFTASAGFHLTAGDYIIVQLQVSNSTKTIGVDGATGGGSLLHCTFTGSLIG